MLCRTCAWAFKRQLSITCLQKNLCNQATRQDDRDPGAFFFDGKVQDLMKKLTRVDLTKVFKSKKEGQKIGTPKYTFMTTEQLDKEMERIRKRADEKLQMPPIVKERDEINTVLSNDVQLDGYETSKIVFTDITYGVSDRDRVIVVRDPGGVLRKANWEERSRMNQIYFERPGRKLVPPKMYEEEYLKDILKRGEYVFLLDQACAQFEPDDPAFIRVRSAVYDHVNATKAFETIRSTRHFGPFAFYLAWKNCIDDLLIDIINGDRLDEALSLIELYHLLQPKSKSANPDKNLGDIETIKAYAELDSSKRGEVELALQNYTLQKFQNVEPSEEEAQSN